MDAWLVVLVVITVLYLILSYWLAYSFFADREEFSEYMRYDGADEDQISEYQMMCEAWDNYGFIQKNFVASSFLIVTVFEAIRGR